MIRKSIFDTPSTPRLYTFLQWVRDGQLFIPDFQRPFEWDDQRRLDLLDSVSRGLPIGAFMVWRTLNQELETYPSLGPFPLPQPPKDEARSYLIDGHQRLTTLYAALEPVEPDALELLQRDAGRWPIFFDLTTDESDPGFVLAPRHRGFEAPITWLPTNELFNPKALWRRQRTLETAGLDRLAERTEDLANAFKDYIVPVLPLVTDDIRAVTDSFVRVNSGGKPMSEDKVLRALVYADFRIDESIDQIRASLSELGWGELKEQIIVNALKVRLQLDVYRSSPVDVRRQVETGGAGAEGWRRVMNELREGLCAAASLLNSRGFYGPGMLPYQYQMIGLSEALLRIAGPDRSKLEQVVDIPNLRDGFEHWMWATTYAGYFTGMTGNRIRDAVDHLTDVLRGKADPLPKDLNRRIERIVTFRASSTRSIALVLLMAISQTYDDFGARLRARLNEAGTNAVDKIFPHASDRIPGNRVLTVPEDLRALRDALARDPANIDKDFAGRHFIPASALASLAADPSNYERFFELRAECLDELERSILVGWGLEFDS